MLGSRVHSKVEDVNDGVPKIIRDVIISKKGYYLIRLLHRDHKILGLNLGLVGDVRVQMSQKLCLWVRKIYELFLCQYHRH